MLAVPVASYRVRYSQSGNDEQMLVCVYETAHMNDDHVTNEVLYSFNVDSVDELKKQHDVVIKSIVMA